MTFLLDAKFLSKNHVILLLPDWLFQNEIQFCIFALYAIYLRTDDAFKYENLHQK